MRRTALAVAGGVITAFAVWSMAEAAVTTYKAFLRGANELPTPVATRGTGTAAVSGDSATKEISWKVTFARLSSPAVSAYIRCGATVGARGTGIAVQLANGADLQSPLTGTGTMSAAQFADLQAGRCWVNIATAGHKMGEISGRLHR